MFSRNTHQTVHLICLLLAAFLMPVSVWILSVVSIVMSANWLLGGEYRRKINILRSRPGIMILLALFAMYLVWLLNTTDFHEAPAELRLKLPLLFFPVVAGSTERTDRSLLRMVMLSFIAGCLFATFAGFAALAGLMPGEIRSSRELALFVPSIRLSILLCFATFSSLWLIFSDGGEERQAGTVGRLYKVMLAAAAAAMSYFLFRLLSVTGLVIFVLLLFLTGIFLITAGRRVRSGIIFLAAAAAATAALTILSLSAWNRLHNPADPSVNGKRQLTLSGRAYTHYPEETLMENGYLVWVNVCEEELRQGWNRRSLKAYDGADAAGNELRVTLVRYITAKGMPKDSAAVATLSDSDIFNIEQGYANPLYARKGSPMARAYEIAWEIDRAAGGANPSGHSLTQRPEFYRAAAGIISKHPWTGVGTGDLARAFSDEYASISSPLKPEYRLRAHNQYLTFGVTFGIPGMILAVALLLIPWLMSGGRFSYLFLVFMTVILISMFNDDTFSSFTGAAFFSYFYTLLIVTSAGKGNIHHPRQRKDEC
jgi:O-antigen ligase